MYFLGQKIDYFKPLRHCFDKKTLDKIEPSEEVQAMGWDKKRVIELIAYKGFIDPNYPNQIRTPDLLITLDKFTVSRIDSIHQPKMEVVEKVPVFYRDFAQQNRLTTTRKDRPEACVGWAEQDLMSNGVFVRKEGNNYFFQTDNFLFEVSHEVVLENLYLKDGRKITTINWTEEGCDIYTSKEKTTLTNEHIRWISFYVRNYDRLIPENVALHSKVPRSWFADSTSWTIHPSIWPQLEIEEEAQKDRLTQIWMEDIRSNGIVSARCGRSTKILGWRFLYVWDGFVLQEVKTPDDRVISDISFEGEGLLLNCQHRTSLTKSSPDCVTELVTGNKVSILPEEVVSRLTLHPHAIQRYEQRIDEHSVLSLILEDITQSVYHDSFVVEGAHNDERRKVETDRYGYVISDDMVISVWDKVFNRKKSKTRETFELKSKKKSTPSSTSPKMKHLEHMSELFKSIK